MSKMDQFDYQEAAVKMSAILSKKFGVEVIFGGHPQTDGQKIILPHWPLMDEEMRAALHGVILHEVVGHVNQTDFDLLDRALTEREVSMSNFEVRTWHLLQNVLEDIRIEANAMRHYSGAKHFLDKAVSSMIANTLNVENLIPEGSFSFWDVAFNFCLFNFRFEALDQDQLQHHAFVSCEVFASVATSEVIDQATSIGLKAASLDGNKETFSKIVELTDELFGVLKSACENAPNEVDPKPENGGEDASADAQQEANDTSSGDNDQPGTPSVTDGDKEDSTSLTSGGVGEISSSDGDIGANEISQGNEGEFTEPSSSDASFSQAGEASVRDDGCKENVANRTEKLDVTKDTISENAITDIFSEFIDFVESNHNQNEIAHPISASVSKERAFLMQDSSELLRKVSSIKRRLIPVFEKLVVADAPEMFRSRSGNRLNSRLLSKSRTSSDPLLFKKMAVGEDETASIAFLVDRSSSTKQGDVYNSITRSTLAMAGALESFPSVSTSIFHFPDDNQSKGIICTMPFNGSLAKAAKLWPSPVGSTPLDRALVGASFAILGIESTKKFVIVITDGKPDRVDPAVDAKMRYCKRRGIVVLGVVVSNGTYPPGIFDDSIQISDTAGLTSALRTLVTRNL